MAKHVFISHTSEDKDLADDVLRALEGQHISCWIAHRDVLPGTAYPEAIIKAIEGCRVMVLIFSASANKSRHIKIEVERALDKNKIIVPFRVEAILPSEALEYGLSQSQWQDGLTPPLEARISDLVNSVVRLLQEGENSERSAPEKSSALTGSLPVFEPAEPGKRPAMKPAQLAAGVVVVLLTGSCVWAVVRTFLESGDQTFSWWNAGTVLSPFIPLILAEYWFWHGLAWQTTPELSARLGKKAWQLALASLGVIIAFILLVPMATIKPYEWRFQPAAGLRYGLGLAGEFTRHDYIMGNLVYLPPEKWDLTVKIYPANEVSPNTQFSGRSSDLTVALPGLRTEFWATPDHSGTPTIRILDLEKFTAWLKDVAKLDVSDSNVREQAAQIMLLLQYYEIHPPQTANEFINLANFTLKDFSYTGKTSGHILNGAWLASYLTMMSALVLIHFAGPYWLLNRRLTKPARIPQKLKSR